MASSTIINRGSVKCIKFQAILDKDVDAQNISTSFRFDGTILDVFIDAPAMDGSTFTLNLLDEGTNSLYAGSALDENGFRHEQPGISFVGELTATLSTTSVQTANRTFDVWIYHG